MLFQPMVINYIERLCYENKERVLHEQWEPATFQKAHPIVATPNANSHPLVAMT